MTRRASRKAASGEPGELPALSKVAERLPTSSVRIRPRLAEIGQSLQKLGRGLPKLAKCWPNVGRLQPLTANVWHRSAKFGRCLFTCWPMSAKIWPETTKFGRAWSVVGQRRPIRVAFGPKLGPRSNCLADNCWASVRQHLGNINVRDVRQASFPHRSLP